MKKGNALHGRRHGAGPAVFLIILFLARACPAAQEYRLGVALGMSGTGFLYCKDASDAISLAAEEINAEGGFLGKHPLKISVKDTKTESETAQQAAAELIKEGVRCILGTYSSVCAVKVKSICRDRKVLHLAGISNAENISLKDFSPYTFSLVPNSYMQARAVVLGIARMAEKKGWKKYVTIASDYEWGRSAQQNTVALLKKEAPDLELLKAFWPPLGESRFQDYIMAIALLKPDFIYGSLGSKDNYAWMTQAGSAGLFQRIPYPGSLISVSELITQAKTLERGMIGLCRAPFFAHPDEVMMQAFVENFRKKYNRYPSDWAVMAYDSVYALKQGIEKAGTVESETVKDALRGSAVQTCRGRLFFRKTDNQLSCSSYLGVIADDPAYPFPVYHELTEVKAEDSWRSEADIAAIRSRDKSE
jgi:branched-chain amino acid transport system substrate-binding protein